MANHISYDDIQRVLFSHDIEKYVPDGVAHSRPVLDLIEGEVVDAFFLYSIDRKTNKVTPPHSRIAVYTNIKKLAYYYTAEEKPFESCENDCPFSLTQHPFDDIFKHWKSVYETSYETIRTFVFQKEIIDSQKSVLKDYIRAFDYIIPKELKPFYIELSPTFFSWIKEILKDNNHRSYS